MYNIYNNMYNIFEKPTSNICNVCEYSLLLYHLIIN